MFAFVLCCFSTGESAQVEFPGACVLSQDPGFGDESGEVCPSLSGAGV